MPRPVPSRKLHSNLPPVFRFVCQSAQENAVAIAAEQQVREDALRRQLKARGAPNPKSVTHAKEVLTSGQNAPVEATVDVADDADEIAVPSLLSKATTDRVLSNRFPPTEAGLSAVSQSPKPNTPLAAAGAAVGEMSSDHLASDPESRPARKSKSAAAGKRSSGRRRSSRGAAQKASCVVVQAGTVCRSINRCFVDGHFLLISVARTCRLAKKSSSGATRSLLAFSKTQRSDVRRAGA